MRNRMLSALTLITLTAVPLYAHRLALKNGDTLQFENYQVSESTLFYTSADGKQIAIPLTNVDLDRTQQLNANETVPLDLPGIILPSSHGTDGAQSSLGEIARQQRKNTTGASAKRVFTDDDVVHSSQQVPTAPTAPTVLAAAPAEGKQMPPGSEQKIVDTLANKTQTQLANEVVGEVQFPGRDAWEQKLYGQAQRLLKFAQSYLDRTKKLDTITNPEERSAAIETANNFDWQVNVEQTAYTQIAADGSQQAKKFQKQPK